MNNAPSLPPHGRIPCRRCFTGPDDVQENGLWQAVNDPGAWGSQTPSVLVLGFSKGFTQAGAYRQGDFNGIPFKGMRTRLTSALHRLGLLAADRTVDGLFDASEREFAFGSLVRCSLSRLNVKTGKRECTGAVMPKAFKEPVSSMVHECAETFLSALPPSVRLVVMLGSGDPYIAGCRNLMKSVHPRTFEDINSVAYRAAGARWVHIAHPSGMNGFFDDWMAGSPTDKSGAKLIAAMSAVQLVGKVA